MRSCPPERDSAIAPRTARRAGDPSVPLNDLGLLLHRAGKHAEALEARAHKASPASPDRSPSLSRFAFHSLARCFEQLHAPRPTPRPLPAAAWASAFGPSQVLRRALAVRPGGESMLLTASASMAALGDASGGLAMLQPALEAGTASASVYHNAGTLATRLCRLDIARLHLGRAAQLDPGAAHTAAAMRKVDADELGRCLRGAGAAPVSGQGATKGGGGGGRGIREIGKQAGTQAGARVSRGDSSQGASSAGAPERAVTAEATSEAHPTSPAPAAAAGAAAGAQAAPVERQREGQESEPLRRARAALARLPDPIVRAHGTRSPRLTQPPAQLQRGRMVHACMKR